MSYHLTNIQLFLCEIGKGRGISPWGSEENERRYRIWITSHSHTEDKGEDGESSRLQG